MAGHPSNVPMTIADAAWVALAILQRGNPGQDSFTVREIVEKVRDLDPSNVRDGLATHISQHNVANKPARPMKHRLFYRVDRGRFRLYRPGDPADPTRSTGKTHPDKASLPGEFRDLVDWYENEYARQGGADQEDPILRLFGLGKEIWKGVDPVEYQRDLRQDWDEDRV